MTLRNDSIESRRPPPGDNVLIGELCRLAGCTQRTVRHYEAEGLVEPLGRTAGGHKLYPREAAEVIQLVGVFGMIGRSLKDVRRLLELAQSKQTGRHWLTLRLREALVEALSELDRRRSQLDRIRNRLAEVIEASERCPKCSAKDCAGCPPLAKLRTLGMEKPT